MTRKLQICPQNFYELELELQVSESSVDSIALKFRLIYDA